MSAARAHWLQHVPFEGLGCIEPWLVAQGYEITCTRFFDSADLPEPAEVDLLVVMGGPMSVHDEHAFAWLSREKEFIGRCIGSGKAVLGICLGAQLIAQVMGARVYPNRAKEIGWFPVHGVPAADEASFRFPAALEVFHWHGETFDLPSGARLLANSQACDHQAFQLGAATIGLQFHLETTPESAREIVAHCRDELLASEFVQSEAAILSAGPRQYRAINELMAGVLSYLRAAGRALAMQAPGADGRLATARSDADYAAARSLFEEYAGQLGVDLCFQGFADELGKLRSMYAAPSGFLLLGMRDGVPAACVAVRRLDEKTCELKRLYVRASARRFGLGRGLVVGAVAAARESGYTRMVLDTLSNMTAARALYASVGFRETAPYYVNPLPDVQYLQLELAAAGTS